MSAFYGVYSDVEQPEKIFDWHANRCTLLKLQTRTAINANKSWCRANQAKV